MDKKNNLKDKSTPSSNDYGGSPDAAFDIVNKYGTFVYNIKHYLSWFIYCLTNLLKLSSSYSETISLMTQSRSSSKIISLLF